jgi:dephospho-CoA kinase
MGKSTTAAMFRDAGVPVWDADAAVHRLYGPGGKAVPKVAALAPPAVRAGAVDRNALRAWVTADAGRLPRLEAAVHPLVADDRAEFLRDHADQGTDLVILDIPLLYETGADALADAVVVVTAPPDMQRARVLARPGMTGEALDAILARQMPDAEKRRRADYVITTEAMDTARAAVHRILSEIRSKVAAAQGTDHA